MNAVARTDKWRWVVVLAVVLLTVTAHVRGLRGDFLLWDDDSHITQNAAIRSGFCYLLQFEMPTTTLISGMIAQLEFYQGW